MHCVGKRQSFLNVNAGGTYSTYHSAIKGKCWVSLKWLFLRNPKASSCQNVLTRHLRKSEENHERLRYFERTLSEYRSFCAPNAPCKLCCIGDSHGSVSLGLNKIHRSIHRLKTLTCPMMRCSGGWHACCMSGITDLKLRSHDEPEVCWFVSRTSCV
jgi:hypothetical protein